MAPQARQVSVRVAAHNLANTAIPAARTVTMIVVTSVEAQNRFGELLDRAQREPVAVTRHGRTVAYVVSAADLPADPGRLHARRQQAAAWFAAYQQAAALAIPDGAPPLTDAEVVDLVRAER